MKKKPSVHFARNSELLDPACGCESSNIVKDRRRVTCENCIKTKVYKRGGKL